MGWATLMGYINFGKLRGLVGTMKAGSQGLGGKLMAAIRRGIEWDKVMLSPDT